MHIAVIGIGDIAQKAYLPVISALPDLTVHLCTRNVAVLEDVARKYRMPHTYTDVRALADVPLDAVFIHAATAVHESLITPFLERQIPVFVDKPITDHYDTSANLVDLAKRHVCPLVVGFNRRFAPAYQAAQAIPEKDIIVMQKNRRALPGKLRSFIMDDFIHVVDTLRFLLPGQVDDMRVQYRMTNALLSYVIVELKNRDTSAIGIMHRESGISEEHLEVLAQGQKHVVRNLIEAVHYEGIATIPPNNDWMPTLQRRGFIQMVSAFIDLTREYPRNPLAVAETAHLAAEDALVTHRICEDIITDIHHTIQQS